MKSGLLRFGVFVCAFLSVTIALSANERPNIILMMADDLGWGDPSCNDGWIETPALDDMVAGGLKFNRFYASSPVCSPTRASCLTGRHPYRLGIKGANSGRLAADESVLSEVLQKAGYTCGHFGKWHLGTLTTVRKDSNRGRADKTKVYSPPWQHGFDTCFSTEAKVPTFHPMRRTDNDRAEPKSFDDGNFYGTYYWKPPTDRTSWATAAEGMPVDVTDNLSGDDSRVIMDRAIPFIQSAVADSQPFFAVIWFHTPHKPLVDPQLKSKVDSEDAYTDAVQNMDRQIGRLRGELKNLGVADNTMLWFCSDNGPEQGVGKSGPFRARKRSLHEGGVRVPGVLVWPDKIADSRSTDFPTVTSDYYPTIVDLLGLSVPDQKPLDGISLRGVIESTASDRKRPIGFRHGKQRSWVNQRYKLISKNEGQSFELYDLLADPDESDDASLVHPKIVSQMLGELNVWLMAVDADE